MYTSHGHHIVGTILDGNPPPSVARCGGPGLCSQCAREAARATNNIYQQGALTVPESPTTKAARLVVEHELKRLEHSDPVSLTTDDVLLVWFAKTLQNWKAILITTRPDRMIYEVTYNGDKKETYVDSYKKWENSAYPDVEDVS